MSLFGWHPGRSRFRSDEVFGLASKTARTCRDLSRWGPVEGPAKSLCGSFCFREFGTINFPSNELKSTRLKFNLVQKAICFFPGRILE